MKITIARIVGPADQHGAIIGPAAIPAGAAVPLFAEFDYTASPIGQAVVHPDGSADLELAPGIALDVERLEADATIGISYRVLEEHEEGGARVIDRLELMAVGVSRALILRAAPLAHTSKLAKMAALAAELRAEAQARPADGSFSEGITITKAQIALRIEEILKAGDGA